jgi:16S rRNA (guanine527-N7)-methyltransferase
MENLSGVSLIRHYFPMLTDLQVDQLDQLMPLYTYWNERINVISRKDLPNLYLHHVLHSLAIAHVVSFKEGTRVVDVGTGGGFPGIPLAILFPDAHFHLVDSIGKKIKVVRAIAEALDLKNVTQEQIRAEELKTAFDFAVTRAVAPLATVYRWMAGKILSVSRNTLPNGLLFLKGGDLSQEIDELNKPCQVFDLHIFFKEEYFTGKKVVYVPVDYKPGVKRAGR